MDKDFKKLYIQDVLNEIKGLVRKNHIVINGDKELNADKKMIDVIDDLCVKNNKDSEEKYCLKVFSDDNNENTKVKYILELYYTAIYFDNVDLLQKLITNSFNFKNSCGYNETNLFVLDPKLSNRFEFNEYVSLLNTNIELFKNFYKSLNKEYNKLSNEEAINKFVNIIKTNPEVIKSNNKYDKYLSKDALEMFSEKALINLTEEQKDTINHVFDSYYYSDDLKEYIVNLIEKHNFSNNLIFWEEFQDNFTIDELLNLSKGAILAFKGICCSTLHYDNIENSKKIAFKSFKEIIKVNPDFHYRFEPIVYETLDTNQILKLTDKYAEWINNCIFNYNVKTREYELKEDILIRWIKGCYRSNLINNSVKKLVRKKEK